MASEVTTAKRPTLTTVLPRLGREVNRAFGVVLLALVAVWLVGNFIDAPEQFISVTLLGITYGAMYCLVALGYTLVYGIIELINFAHGDVFMWGSMAAVTVGVSWLGLDGGQNGFVTALLVLVTLLAAMTFCGAGNVVIERFAYRPLRNAPKLAPLITAIGMSFILQALALRTYGPTEQTADNVFPNDVLFSIGGTAYRQKSLVVVLITIPVLMALVYLVRSTRQGKAMRATAQDGDAARMMGINVDRTIAFTFLLGGALAGAGGTLWAFWQTSTRYDLGFQLGLFAFTAAVLGGIGNLNGAALGAMLIGLLQAYNDGLSWHTPGGDWTQSMIFAVLILILVFRPQGLLGEQVSDRA
ncbi:MAG: branched-chain amino acid transport system permease protein [Gaiellales bacterium]|nr:branched-chain amino acid transport system permease protein [Gaiellales bacterium]